MKKLIILSLLFISLSSISFAFVDSEGRTIDAYVASLNGYVSKYVYMNNKLSVYYWMQGVGYKTGDVWASGKVTAYKAGWQYYVSTYKKYESGSFQDQTGLIYCPAGLYCVRIEASGETRTVKGKLYMSYSWVELDW